MLIRSAEVAGALSDVRVADGQIVEVGGTLSPEADEDVFDAAGGALLPGLQDHHLHLHALAAALSSVDCGPGAVRDRDALARALAEARPERGWIRGTGYFESVAGPLDRDILDALGPDRPIRIQHRSGVMWFLNSRALEALSVGPEDDATIERDAKGRATGRLFRGDAWLRERLPAAAAPDLSRVGRTLARFGVTRVTDCTASNGPEEAGLFAKAQASGALPQDVEMMGRLDADVPAAPGLRLGAHKIMLDEPALPAFDALVHAIEQAHASARCVAFHAVTRAELLFALAALEAAGVRSGDRIEHASVAPPEAIEAVRRLGVVIVTQPNFVAERGDAYRVDVDPRDRPHLYRVRTWRDAGVSLRGGTDAPFGQADPWRAMHAATERRTRDGIVLGADERVSPEAALRLFLPDWAASRVGGGVPGPRAGDRADLCLLDAPWHVAREGLSSERVVATWRRGRRIDAPSPPGR